MLVNGEQDPGIDLRVHIRIVGELDAEEIDALSLVEPDELGKAGNKTMQSGGVAPQRLNIYEGSVLR